jgi:catechol 2,3-dioxygenase
MDAIASLGSVSLRVRDLHAASAFYTDVLGLEIIHAEGELETLGIADVPIIHLHGASDADPRSPQTTGLYHFAILLPSRRDLAAFYKHLVSSKAKLHGFADHLVSEALYFEDLEGNGIEVYADRPRDQWQYDGSQIRMATLPLDVERLMAESMQPWSGIPEGTSLGHVHLHVSHLDQAIQFYQDTIGFDMVGAFGDQAAFLSVGGYHHHIGINTWIGEGAPGPTKGTAGLHWFSILITSEQQLQAIRVRLENAGAEAEIDGDKLTTADPSGNGVRLIVGKLS